MLVIRPATPHDLPALRAIEQSATDLYYDAGFSRSAIVPRDDAAMRHLLRYTTVLLARDDDDALGYVSFYPRGPFLHLEEIAVRRDHQRRGCGRRLAAQVLASAESDPQCSHVSLVAFVRAAWALGLYSSLGFRRLVEVEDPLPRAELLHELLAEPAPAAPGEEAREVLVRPLGGAST